MQARFPTPVQTDLRAHPTSSTKGYRVFPVVNIGQGVTLTNPTSSVLVTKEKNYNSSPLLSILPVQNLNACTRVTNFIISAKVSHCNYSPQTPKEQLSNSDVFKYGLQNGHLAVVLDFRMFTWPW